MRLSNELQFAAAWWHEVREGGCEFTAEGALMFERVLKRAVELARDLEERVPAADEARAVLARVNAIMRDGAPDDRDRPPAMPAPIAADNVVPFRRPASRELIYIPIGDGDIA